MLHGRRTFRSSLLLGVLACSAVIALAACGSTPTSSVGPVTQPGVPQADGEGNDAPIVRIDQPPQTLVVTPGAEVALTGGVDDPDHRGPDAPTLRWDFGDGTTAEGPVPPPHRYAAPGEYLVTLSATDAEGASATPATRLVQIGGPAVAQGNSALLFTGAGRDDVDRVKIPLDDPSGARTEFGANVGATDMTVELWMRAEPGANAQPAVECGDTVNWIFGNILLDRDRWGPGRSFGLSVAGGVVVLGVTGLPEGDSVTLCGRTPVDDDRWHHVAMTRSVGSGALALYVDGKLEASRDSGPAGDLSYPRGAKPMANCPGKLPCTLSDPYLVIGAEKHDVGSDSPAFRGQVDELRLSTTIRYPGPFDPPSTRFSPDTATAALYHFDEPGGPIVRDAAEGLGSPTDGVVRKGADPVGPVRVSSDAPTGP
jgi:PKD repeat protein